LVVVDDVRSARDLQVRLFAHVRGREASRRSGRGRADRRVSRFELGSQLAKEARPMTMPFTPYQRDELARANVRRLEEWRRKVDEAAFALYQAAEEFEFEPPPEIIAEHVATIDVVRRFSLFLCDVCMIATEGISERLDGAPQKAIGHQEERDRVLGYRKK
jgi:hypothetical protein